MQRSMIIYIACVGSLILYFYSYYFTSIPGFSSVVIRSKSLARREIVDM